MVLEGIFVYSARVVTVGARVVTVGARVVTVGARVVTVGARVVTVGVRVVAVGARIVTVGVRVVTVGVRVLLQWVRVFTVGARVYSGCACFMQRPIIFTSYIVLLLFFWFICKLCLPFFVVLVYTYSLSGRAVFCLFGLSLFLFVKHGIKGSNVTKSNDDIVDNNIMMYNASRYKTAEHEKK